MGEIWAIILAAGESKRMGVPKMFLIFNGKSMLENVIENVTASEVNNTIVVLGAEKDSLIELIGKSDVLYCYNDKFKEGMLSSVKCGFNNLPSDYKAVLVFQGDQPFITPRSINTVINAYLLSGKGIVIPTFQNKRGHPLLIDRKYSDEVEKLSAARGLRSLADMFSDDVMEVATNESGILRDFDTYEEYMKEINQIQ